MDPRADLADRLPRPDHPAPARAAPDLADRRRRPAGAGHRHRRRQRFPHRRCDGRRRGRAAGAALSRRAGARGGQNRGVTPPVAVVNIGGVANVTWVGADGVLAFDTGPGNAPIDDWAQQHTGTPVDEFGALARQGKIDNAALDDMLAHAFFERVPPKSLDRMDFGAERVAGLSAGGWRGDADGLHGGLHRAGARAFPRSGHAMGRVRRRAAQSGADGQSQGAGECARSRRRGSGLARRFPRSRSLRLSRGTRAPRPATQPADDDRCPKADAGRKAPSRAIDLVRSAIRAHRHKRRSRCARLAQRSGHATVRRAPRRRLGRRRGVSGKIFRTILFRARGADRFHTRDCKAILAKGDKFAA